MVHVCLVYVILLTINCFVLELMESRFSCLIRNMRRLGELMLGRVLGKGKGREVRSIIFCPSFR